MQTAVPADVVEGAPDERVARDPKMAVHTLSSLTGAIKSARAGDALVWSTFYDIRRYGGLQIFLRALMSGASLVLSSAAESTSDFLIRAGAHGVTNISGTPSHWRRALMSPSAHAITPRYVRLSGEIVDQVILDNLRAFYPNATIVHAFASTEAGVGFDVHDGLAGFPGSLIGQHSGDVELKVEDGSLQIRSARTARPYQRHLHARMPIDHRLDFLGMYLEAANIDDAVAASDEVVAVAVQLDHIARVNETVRLGERVG